jgi:hypothetical protein
MGARLGQLGQPGQALRLACQNVRVWWPGERVAAAVRASCLLRPAKGSLASVCSGRARRVEGRAGSGGRQAGGQQVGRRAGKALERERKRERGHAQRALDQSVSGAVQLRGRDSCQRACQSAPSASGQRPAACQQRASEPARHTQRHRGTETQSHTAPLCGRPRCRQPEPSAGAPPRALGRSECSVSGPRLREQKKKVGRSSSGGQDHQGAARLAQFLLVTETKLLRTHSAPTARVAALGTICCCGEGPTHERGARYTVLTLRLSSAVEPGFCSAPALSFCLPDQPAPPEPLLCALYHPAAVLAALSDPAAGIRCRCACPPPPPAPPGQAHRPSARVFPAIAEITRLLRPLLALPRPPAVNHTAESELCILTATRPPWRHPRCTSAIREAQAHADTALAALTCSPSSRKHHNYPSLPVPPQNIDSPCPPPSASHQRPYRRVAVALGRM